MVSCALFTKNVMVMTALAMLANGLAIPSLPNGLSLPSLAKRGDGVFTLGFDVHKGSPVSNVTELNAGTKKRSGTLPTPFEADFFGYTVAIELGSYKESFDVSLDTGSSDLWIAANFPNCTKCFTFDSATAVDTGVPFNITYVGGTNSRGGFIKDTINIDGVAVPNFEFAIANNTTLFESGVFGIGFIDLESPKALKQSNYTYPNFPALLKQEGFIAKNAYSLYLDDEDANTGTVIFGGIDYGKYEGTLAKSPVTKYPYLAVDWKGIKTANGTTIKSTGKPVILDSGTSSTGLPTVIIDQIYSDLGAHFDGFFWVAPCDQGGRNFTFELADGFISIPYTNFLFGEGETNCLVWSIYDTTNTTVDILGDVFLRSTYTVYDLDDRTISYAQAVFNDESNIVPLKSLDVFADYILYLYD